MKNNTLVRSALAIAGFLAIALPANMKSAQAQAFETFSVNGGMALNTNNNFARIDGQPRMAIWQHNRNDIDQQFQRLRQADGTFLLRQRSTGKCLNAHRRFDGAEINVWPCNSQDPDQKFVLSSLGSNVWQIRRNGTSLCVDSPTRTNGGKVHMWQCNASNPNQRWLSTGVINPPPPPPPASSGQITLPYRSGETWYVCQGYQNPISHGSTFGLDLSIGQDFGSTGCWAHDGNTSRSASRPVLAPADGRITYVGADLVCLNMGNNRSLLIGHIDRTYPNGANVSRGTVLGTVSRASSVNGRFSHIHIEARRSSTCAPGTSVPFTTANGFQFIGVGDLPDLPGGNDHFRRALRR